ncbi:hypothetical protein HZY83_05395 [Gemella sp. GH3]|uniref:hypothetical protein n=1 Tax=unclassified Gemella TaxID=2624949 RepID=UPI0015D0CC5A|nr:MULTISPECIES: hypothetical protein [unclassified Gemella]MBF0714106.1 hypothetical protein [Gemella sp. GH3.1]NYS51058.1 hypothetical protein [Gemella sp. GH3]
MGEKSYLQLQNEKENLILKIKKFIKTNNKNIENQDIKFYLYIDEDILKVARIKKDKYILNRFGYFNNLEIAQKAVCKFEKDILEINKYGLWA